MTRHQFSNLKNKVLAWVLVGGLGYFGFQFYRSGGFRHGIGGVGAHLAWTLRGVPVVGRPLRKYANRYFAEHRNYKIKEYRGKRSRAIGKHHRSRKGVHRSRSRRHR